MDTAVLEAVRKYADMVRAHLPAKAVVLFGSQVKGGATGSSDIDVAVVVDGFTGDYLDASSSLFALVRGIDTRIEPVLIDRTKDPAGFLESIMKEGHIIFSSEPDQNSMTR